MCSPWANGQPTTMVAPNPVVEVVLVSYKTTIVLWLIVPHSVKWERERERERERD